MHVHHARIAMRGWVVAQPLAAKILYAHWGANVRARRHLYYTQVTGGMSRPTDCRLPRMCSGFSGRSNCRQALTSSLSSTHNPQQPLLLYSSAPSRLPNRALKSFLQPGSGPLGSPLARTPGAAFDFLMCDLVTSFGPQRGPWTPSQRV